jgi:hypothetical protein
LRQILVFNKSVVVVAAQFGEEIVFDEADLVGGRVGCDGFERCRRWEDKAGRRCGALVLRLVGAMHAVLQKVERDAEGFEPVFFCQAQFAEAEEVLVEVFGEVTADELFAAVVEGADAVCAGVVAERRPLEGVSEHGVRVHIAMLTNKSARCDFILSCTTPSFVPNLSTSSFT